jgi:hypothetical protein
MIRIADYGRRLKESSRVAHRFRSTVDGEPGLYFVGSHFARLRPVSDRG